MEDLYSTDASYLVHKKLNQWTAEDLNLCGKLLIAGGHPELKRMLTIHPDVVAGLLGVRKGDPAGPDVPEDVNLALCRAAAAAFERNKGYYGPMLKNGDNTVGDFCSLVWEYLQTEAFTKRQSECCFSMTALLAEAAKPKGWIGCKPVFLSRDREHAYRVGQKVLRPRLYDSMISADLKTGDDDHSLMDDHTESVFGTSRDPYAAAESRTDLEALTRQLEACCPQLDMRLYMWVCLQERSPVNLPPPDLIAYCREKGPEPLRSMSDTEIRLWFHRHYTALERTCRGRRNGQRHIRRRS